MSYDPQPPHLSHSEYRTQKELLCKMKEINNSLYRSAAQAQRNFDQYLTAMEHVGAMYKEYGELLSALGKGVLRDRAQADRTDDVKSTTARVHSAIHKWQRSGELYAVRQQLNLQTQLLKSRNDHASRVLNEYIKRDELVTTYNHKNSRLEKKSRKESTEVEGLRKECNQLKKQIAKCSEVTQRDLDSMFVNSTATIKSLSAQLFKVMHKNGAFIAERFAPDRLEMDVVSLEALNDDVVTGVIRRPHSARSEVSSIAPSGVYGQNYNRFNPHEVDPRVSGSVRNQGIPLRYEANAPPGMIT